MDGPQREVLTSKPSSGTSASAKHHQNSPALPDFLKRTACNTVVPASVGRVSSPSLAIPDYHSAGISDTITVPESVTIAYVKVGLDISPTSPKGLRATLTTPWGVVVELLSRGAGGRTQAVKFTCAEAKLPALSTPRGRNTQGAWKLTVQDLKPADKRTLNSWDLDIGTAATTTGHADPGLPSGRHRAVACQRQGLCDWQVSLASPHGTAIMLHNGAGRSTRDLAKTYIAAGTWQLRIVDRAAQDQSKLNSWRLVNQP
jgi:subtilisin-like proprotein convertase family protein